VYTESANRVADTNSELHIGFGDRKNSGRLEVLVNKIAAWEIQGALTVTISLEMLLLLDLLVR
jgi:hypothetical protein